jgi:GNAT superfamily N-acetyltransferase
MKPRLASAADVPAIVTVTNRAYRVEDFFVIGDRTNERDIREKIAMGYQFLVVDADDRLAGSVYYEIRGPRGYFGMLAVDPDWQKRGIAKLLLDEIEARCRVAGCAHLDMDIVNLREELPAFYEKMGFRPVATAPFPHPPKLKRAAHMILMTKPLGAGPDPIR